MLEGNTGPITFPDQQQVVNSDGASGGALHVGFGISKDFASRAAELIIESLAAAAAATLAATPNGSPAAVLNGTSLFVLNVTAINPSTGQVTARARNIVGFITDRTAIDNQVVTAHADITVAPAVNAGAVDFVITNAAAGARKLVVEVWALGGPEQRFNFADV